MITGWICFVLSVLILWFNEGHVVRMEQLFALARRRVKTVESKPTNEDNKRELVHVVGVTETSDTLKLATWGNLEAPPSSCKLRSMVWMYQWVEHQKEKDKQTVYEYKKEWKAHHVDSSRFKHKAGHENPPMTVEHKEVQLGTTTLGDFAVPKRILSQMQAWMPCDITDAILDGFSRMSQLSSYSKGRLEGRTVYFAKGGHGSLGSPSIGDLKANFEYVSCGTLTVLGVQVLATDISLQASPGAWSFAPLQFTTHHSFVPSLKRAYTGNTNIGDSKHETLLGECEADEYVEETRDTMKHIKHGIKALLKRFASSCSCTQAVDEFFKSAAPDHLIVALEKEATSQECINHEVNFQKKLSWGIRLFGFCLMKVSLEAIFAPMKLLFAYMWFVGWIMTTGIHMVTWAITCCCSGFTVGAAWITFRPLYAIALMGIPLMIIAVSHKMNAQPPI